MIIYEAAIRHKNLFIRVDILIKKGSLVELVEVKAKSFNSSDTEDEFFNRSGTIFSEWKPYLADIAFQKYVFTSSFPEYTVNAYLMMADKNAICSTDGLNQKFKITKDEYGRKKVLVSDDLSKADLHTPVLARINVDNSCNIIYDEPILLGDKEICFEEYINFLSEHYKNDKKISSPPSSTCANCEFKADETEISKGLKSGYRQCWQERLGWKEKDFSEPTVLDIWNFRKKNIYIDAGIIKLSDIDINDINPKADSKPGISTTERQWLQIQKAVNKDSAYWIDSGNLRREMKSWTYPLHFIDFETSMVAIPFNKGRRPYEGIAFQFSHHIVYEDGRVEHKGQYLNSQPGIFPNYDFIRNLKKELETDNGSIFRYAPHENIYLNFIYQQLIEDYSDIYDREELCEFIRTITKSSSSVEEAVGEEWEGPRNMIDMLELVKRYYYDPAMKGSNSIKYVLPAILNSSRYLQEKYSEPIYGVKSIIPSHNFENWTWIEFRKNKVVNPYELLPKMFQDMPDEELIISAENNELRDGGAAMIAYSRMQFEEMSEYERKEINKALLKYCELDTMAMVMIYEGWRNMVG